MTASVTRELGRAIVNFARLEWNLAYAISGLTGPYAAAGQMVALELPFRKKCILFQSLCRHELELSSRGAVAELRRLEQRLADCDNSLKHFSHPLWLAAPRDRRGGRPIRSRMTALESRRPPAFQKVDVGRLKRVADEFARLAEAIPRFVRHHSTTDRREGGGRRPTRG